MKTNVLYEGKTVLMFHIKGGGGNNRQLEFVGDKKITDCYDWDANTFLHDEDEEGNALPEDQHYLHDCSGHELMDAEELKKALETGIGCLDFDGDYDTTYTEYLEDISENEYWKLDEDWKRIYQIVINNIPEDKLDGILEDDDLDYMFHYEYKE